MKLTLSSSVLFFFFSLDLFNTYAFLMCLSKHLLFLSFVINIGNSLNPCHKANTFLYNRFFLLIYLEIHYHHHYSHFANHWHHPCQRYNLWFSTDVLKFWTKWWNFRKKLQNISGLNFLILRLFLCGGKSIWENGKYQDQLMVKAFKAFSAYRLKNF